MSDVIFNMSNNSMVITRSGFVRRLLIPVVHVTGGRLKRVRDYVKDETFCFTPELCQNGRRLW